MGAAFGGAFGAAGAGAWAWAAFGAPGAGCWACAPEAINVADNAEAANRAKICPRGRIDPAKIRKFIAENPF